MSAIRHVLIKQAQSTQTLKYRLEKQHLELPTAKAESAAWYLDMRLRRGMTQYLKQQYACWTGSTSFSWIHQ